MFINFLLFNNFFSVTSMKSLWFLIEIVCMSVSSLRSKFSLLLNYEVHQIELLRSLSESKGSVSWKDIISIHFVAVFQQVVDTWKQNWDAIFAMASTTSNNFDPTLGFRGFYKGIDLCQGFFQ